MNLADETTTPGLVPSNGQPPEPVFWRAEGSLLNLTAVRPVAFFTWNAQSFLERWMRRGTMGVLAVARPFLYLSNRIFATRVLHTVLRGESRDRLDLLGDEFFQYFLKPRLNRSGVENLTELVGSGADVVLVSQALDHIMRPMADYLGVRKIISNRLDFRDGLATGRLLDPVIRPRGVFAKLSGQSPDGKVSRERLLRDLGLSHDPQLLDDAIRTAHRSVPRVKAPVVDFGATRALGALSVRESLRGKSILLIGSTGFIGKVWLAALLTDLPEIHKIYLLIRSHRTTSSLGRFQRVLDESPVFDPLVESTAPVFPIFFVKKSK